VEDFRITDISIKVDDLKIPINLREEARKAWLQYSWRHFAMSNAIALKVIKGERYNFEEMMDRFYWPAITEYQTKTV